MQAILSLKRQEHLLDYPCVVARDKSGPDPNQGPSWYRFGTDCCVDASKTSTYVDDGDAGDAPGRIYTDRLPAGAERSLNRIQSPRLKPTRRKPRP